uniref:Extended synaptotagmin 3 n=1 Tax=Athene cunicularia TaxID=194338 RepID=A0A663N5X5_ATHCN
MCPEAYWYNSACVFFCLLLFFTILFSFYVFFREVVNYKGCMYEGRGISAYPKTCSMHAPWYLLHVLKYAEMDGMWHSLLFFFFVQVHFPDVERVEWLNKVLVQAWPYFGTIMEKTFKEVLEPKIRAKNVHLKTCTFTKIHFGEKCPRINGIKAYTKEIDRRQVILDLQICYIGDCEIHMDISKFNLGVKGVQLYGTLRVILEPLLTDAPFIGAVTLFFMQKPVSQAPVNFIAARLVLPNRITVPLKKNMNIALLRFPIPHVSVFQLVYLSAH